MSSLQPDELVLLNEAATLNFGAKIAATCKGGVFYLSGDLGVGKTTLVRGFLRARGFDGAVKSPTYTLIEPYELPGAHVAHLDLYRIRDAEELYYIGLDDIVAESNFMFVEWPENGRQVLPPADFKIHIERVEDHRSLRIDVLTAPNAS